MEFLHADYAILLATLSCAILPLFSLLIYVCLPRRWNSASTQGHPNGSSHVPVTTTSPTQDGAKTTQAHGRTTNGGLATSNKLARADNPGTSLHQPIAETATAAHALPANKKPMTYRVRSIPLDWDETQLNNVLKDNGVDLEVKSLALDIGGDKKIATGTVERGSSNPPTVPDLSLDDGFEGITTFYAPSPEDHKIDIVAISGLGGHGFGSFKSRKKASHMWLRDDLPKNIPMARIMTYGYNSRVAQSYSHDTSATLANGFNSSLLVLANTSTRKPLIVIGHSLGGLIVKRTNPRAIKAMLELSWSTNPDTVELYKSVYGIVFFGVPHGGMNIDHLKPMVGDAPNNFLVQTLDRKISMPTDDLSRDFAFGLGGRGESEVYCYYETKTSPVPEKASSQYPLSHIGEEWRMSKDKFDYLVTKQSATRYCKKWVDGVDHESPIPKNHSDMVKFDPGDTTYEMVQRKLHDIAKRALERKPRIVGTIEGLIPVPR
ncbi:hypothetical protein PG987_000598 [Apiospora arundinis]